MRRQGLPRGKRDRPRPKLSTTAQTSKPQVLPKTTPSVHALDVLDLAGRGDGVCRLPDGAVVLVPGAVPGDRIEVALEPVRAGVLRGRIVRLITPSPDRTTPPCPVAARCGGCTWLHVSLQRLRESKASLASRAVRTAPTH